MLSKMITDRRKQRRDIVSALRVHGDAIAEGFETLLAPELKATETLPDIPLLLELLARSLRQRDRELEEHLNALRRDGFADAAERRRHEELKTALYDHLVRLRRLFRLVPESRLPGGLGIRGRTSRNPSMLYLQGGQVLRTLEDIPTIEIDGTEVDLTERRQELARLVEEYGAHLNTLAGELVHRPLPLTASGGVVETFDRQARRTLGLLQDFLGLAGHEGLIRSILRPR